MSKQPVRIVTAEPLPSSFPAEEFDGQIELRVAPTNQERRAAVAQAEVFYGSRVPETVPAEAPHLKWIQLPSAGADDLRRLPVWQSDVLITSSAGIHTVPMTEHFFAMLLALTRHLPTVVRAQERHDWTRNWHEAGLRFLELRGKTLGIVGWGKIGQGIAHMAHAFGMRVVGTRSSATARQVPQPPEAAPYADPPWLEPVAAEPDTLYPAAQLHEVLAQSDVVLLILPLTKQTERLFRDAELGAMKRGSLFFNIGRGAVVDEDALLRALRDGQIAGAGLDVFAEEPLPSSSPLWSMENVIVSPHVGGLGERTNERAAGFFGVNLKRYLQGEPLLNVVDRSREY